MEKQNEKNPKQTRTSFYSRLHVPTYPYITVQPVTGISNYTSIRLILFCSGFYF